MNPKHNANVLTRWLAGLMAGWLPPTLPSSAFIHSNTSNNSNKPPINLLRVLVLFASLCAGGLSAKSYAGNNRQSDEQAARVINLAYYEDRFDNLGFKVWVWQAALVSSAWTAKHFYRDIEDAFFNIMVAYYLILTNMCLCEETFGSPFCNNLPQVTIQNSLGNIANFVERCVHWDLNVPFLPWCQIEWPCETHFGECKKYVRGMGRLKDMIQGAGA